MQIEITYHTARTCYSLAHETSVSSAPHQQEQDRVGPCTMEHIKSPRLLNCLGRWGVEGKRHRDKRRFPKWNWRRAPWCWPYPPRADQQHQCWGRRELTHCRVIALGTNTPAENQFCGTSGFVRKPLSQFRSILGSRPSAVTSSGLGLTLERRRLSS